MDKLLNVFIGLVFFIFILIIFGAIEWTHENNEKDLACKALGLEDYKYANRIGYCEDASGNLYYVNMECKPWYWPECTAKPISVGFVRTLEDLR